MSFENIRLDLFAPLVRITVDRPKVLNALNSATLQELEEAFEMAAFDESIRVILLTGGGEKAFVAGADICELAEVDALQGRQLARHGQALFSRIENLGKPVIACINGFALGGGCELAMACTVRLASESARLGQPEVKLGIIAGYGGTQRLPRLVGKGAALKLLLTGEIISASEAHRIGLVDEVVPDDKLMERAEALGNAMAAVAPVAVTQTLAAVHDGYDLPLDQALAHEAALFAICCSTEDKDEGTKAFLEKRQPVWSGK